MGIKFLALSTSFLRSFSTTGRCNQNLTSKRTKRKTNNYPKLVRGRIEWTNEQKRVISAVHGGKSVFITGSAGTGKTALLLRLISSLHRKFGKSRVFVTASTGIAACAIKGQTLHSFAGVKIWGDRVQLVERVLADKKACRRWERAKALVIDECSMIEGEILDELDCIARKVRNSNKPWGGIQLVVSGDFFQLPPVIKGNYTSGRKEFAFEADCWNESFDLQVQLSKIFRQSDERFIQLLQGVRKGDISPENSSLLQQACSSNEPDSSVVQLFPRNDDVDRVNQNRISMLGEKLYVFEAVDGGAILWRGQLKQGIAPDRVSLCKGARVMLIKNLNMWHGLVNGATGTIIRFVEEDVEDMCPDKVVPVVKFDSGKTAVVSPETWNFMEGDTVMASRKQIPLVLAWAMSIHKCQGLTLDSIHTDLKRAFGYGMVYVALSRVRTLSGLHLSGFDPSKIKAHPKVLKFYESIVNEGDEHTKNAAILRCN